MDIEFTKDGVTIDGEKVDINDEGFGELAFGKGAVRLYDHAGRGVGWVAPQAPPRHSFWKRYGPLLCIVVAMIIVAIIVLIGGVR